jgi:predicted DNA-binding protein YlxM (UPF0122 family)
MCYSWYYRCKYRRSPQYKGTYQPLICYLDILTAEQRNEIQTLMNQPDYNLREIARDYNLDWQKFRKYVSKYPIVL